MIDLKINGKYTIIEISDFLACSIKTEITITQKIGERYVFKQRGKRKEYYLKEFNKGMLFFENWDLWIIPDSDFKVNMGDFTTKSFKGNALLNIVGEPEKIKSFIDSFNLNPLLDKGIVIATGENNDKEIPVYMDLAEQSRNSHAVLDRILNKIEVKQWQQ